MANKKWGPKTKDGHVNNTPKRRRMKRAHESKTRQEAKKQIRDEGH